MKECGTCGILQGKGKFTKGQWKKSDDIVCRKCTATIQAAASAPSSSMDGVGEGDVADVERGAHGGGEAVNIGLSAALRPSPDYAANAEYSCDYEMAKETQASGRHGNWSWLTAS